MHRILALALVGLMPLALSCEAEEEETLGDLVDQLLDEWDAQAQILCQCWETLVDADGNSFNSAQDCQNYVGGVLPSQRQCFKNAFATDEAASESYLNCHIPLNENLTTCYNQQVTCDNFNEGRDTCQNDYTIGAGNCIELPASVQRALDDCFL